jgi:hypothetical protein
MQTLEQLRAGELHGARRLKLACGLAEFPREIFTLADTLEILDLSGNALSSLPADLPRLARLRIIFCSDNQFTELPEILGACPELSMVGFKANRISAVSATSLPDKLRWLILTDNAITELPPEISQRPLQKLMLAGNNIHALPPEMAACSKLELLRISANQLTGMPAWLLDLPRLGWLAYAGNPFCGVVEAKAARNPIAAIPWHQLFLQNKLGEGASGQIYRAEHLGNPVAVKLFKGAVTSDGLPDCEMAACISAGAHPGLLPVLGKVPDHPQQVQALVMPLIAPAFINLAGPPSFDTCTRDVYPAGKRFSLRGALGIAHDVASAARHLHARGIMHGDLYGHNVLHCGEGSALLGDFGAASFHDPGSPHATALERIEVRAFGCLLEELLERCDGDVPPQLALLRDDCLLPAPASRPLFQMVEQRLRSLLDNH